MKIANNIKVFILLLVGIVLGMSVINVNAATVPTSVKMKSKSLLYYFTEKKKTDYIDGYNFYRKELDDGTLAYCSSNITSHVPAGKTLKLKGEVTDKGLAYIIKNGYPHKSFTGDAKKDYYITQAAVWRYYDETRGSKNWSSSAFKSTSTGMRKYVYDLVQQAKKANSSTSITSSVSATISSDTMTISGNEFVSKQISVSLTNTLSTYTVSLENAPAKTKILDVNGKEKTTFNKGEKFVVTTPISNISGSIKIKISATGVDSKVYEYSTGNSYYQDIIVVTEYETTKDVSTTLKLNFNLNTKVSISKQDITTKKELAGATLIVKDINGKEIDKWVSNGKLHYIENILPGDYTLTEISAPNGYKLSSETVKFTVKTDGTVQSVVMFNEKEITKVSISKQDMANGKELPGATLIVKDANGKEVARWVSTDKPHYIEGLAEGKYTLTEISAPSGYKLSSETISFELKADGTVQGVTMLNEREVTKVSISKQDMANGKELPGATLIVKDANGKEVARWVSTDKPHYIEGLAEGKYTLTEISAPSGYKLSSETISFELKADGKIQSVTMLNAREVTKLRISKKDISTKEELVGATLVVKDSTGKVVDRFTSTGEPHYVEGLAVGSYTLEEEKAPSGYKLSTEKISFRLANDGNVQEVVMYNTKDITRLRISKQDMGTKTELAGATLVIKDKTGKVVTRFVTENTPKYIEGLEPGEYILSEEKAPNGYKLSTETVNFNLKRDGEVKLITFYNVKEVTRIKISKQDITTKKELAGATLVVKDKDGNIVDKWVSTEEPHYIEGLKEGNYTLTEKVAPNGYKLSSETINFTLKADGTIQSVVMYNEKEITKVKISKQDITTKKELPGATLVIKDKSGNVIDTWVSTTEPKYIEGLEPGDYTLT
ncbi:MAG: Cys-Gln thioester bond-forming surface protein, partial [Bacilli bacterium]|nr:Cys-Gln thioester bond-forming surface protein [Bacilli bacterium]